MHLKSLELQGFKSFPDKTLIRFGGDITAIVGPNGSGKSNISDAILWVMGEQSTKTLRGAKMEDVIFGGTQSRSAVGFAEATLTLDNVDRALPYDADEVMVTRRYYRSGDGEYYINKQSARLRDINELFMDTGLGKEGYSNIGQGRIDEILSLKSGDRREIFEEAAGISKYRHRKEETERQLAHTEENLLRIGDKVSELELQVEPLREQSEKARLYLSLKDELQGVEVAVWLDSLTRLSATAKKAQEDYASASFVLQQSHDELDKLYRDAETLAEQLRQRDSALEAARQEQNLLQAAYQQLGGQMAVLHGSMENNNGNIERIREELRGQGDRESSISAQLEQTLRRGEQAGKQMEQTDTRLAALSDELNTMTANSEGLTRQFLQLRQQEGTLSASIAGTQAECGALEDALKQTEDRLATLTSDLSAGQARIDEARAGLDAAREEEKQAEEASTAARNRIDGFTLRQKARQSRRDNAQEKLRQTSQQLDSVQAKLRVYRAMERDYEGYQKSVRLVMQQADKGALRHICGPVSRLIRTDESYTVAVEIALGAAMQQIVVESEADAKAAIAYLKRTGGGRATFLPISLIEGRHLNEPGLRSAHGFVAIAAELVRCDERYRNIIDNLLGRVVIAEDIDAAIAISKKYRTSFRIVTLDGQVMNAGGSMTGGSVNKEAGILSRANELEKLTQEEKALTEQCAVQRAEADEAERLLQQTVFALTGANEELRQAQDSALRAEGARERHEVLLAALTEAAESAQRELDALQQRRTADRERLSAQRGRLQAYNEQLTEARKQLLALEGSQTEAAQKLDELTAKANDLRTERAALEAEKASAADHAEELRALCSAMQGDRDKKNAVIAAMESDNERLQKELEALGEKQALSEREQADCKQKLEKLLRERGETEADKTRTERLTQEKNKDILSQERAVALLEQKKVTSEMEQKQIVDKLWDSYGLTPGTAPEKAAALESVAAGNRRIGELRRKIGALGTPNLGAIDEYARVNERYTYLVEQRDDVLTSKRELESIIRDITKEMTGIFTEQFAKIDHYFGQVFTEMFGGGKGSLVLEDPNDPLGCGIEIRVQPPGKQLKTITLLSGGEKAFVATALYFAILKVRPTPFCLLDEIDAALDDRNVERFAGYLHTLSNATQFIVITHRRGTMEAADVLYGVTMQEQGVSKLLRLDLDEMSQSLGITE